LGNPLSYIDPDGRDTALSLPISLEQSFPDEFADRKKRSAGSSDGLTATQAARELTSQLRQGNAGLVLQHAGVRVGNGESFEVNWKDSRVQRFMDALYQALVNSSSFRMVFSSMLHSPNRSKILMSAGENAVEPWRKTNSDSMEPAWNGTGMPALIFANPDRLGSIMTGGTTGISRSQKEALDTAVVHELYHGWEIQHGHWGGGEWREVRATRFENLYRREAGLLSRDCYFLCDDTTRHELDLKNQVTQ
jgi:hypothetical protein